MDIKKRYYYTFGNYVTGQAGAYNSFVPTWALLFYNKANNQLGANPKYWTITANAHANTLLTAFMEPHYWNSVVKISTTDVTNGDAIDIWDADGLEDLFWTADMNLWAHLAQTFDKYDALLTIYENQIAALYSDASQTVTYNNLTDTSNIGAKGSVSKHNDTPEGSGDFSGDNHATYVDVASNNASFDSNTRSGSVQTSDTAMSRIDEIQSKIRNLYEDWLGEFKECFYDPMGLDE